jgi:hypothetical protein
VTLGGGFLLFRRKAEMPPRAATSAVVLDETLDVPAGGVSRRVRVAAPSVLEFTLAPRAGTAVDATFGAAQPVERSPVDAPDPAGATTWTASAGDPPRTRLTLVPGLYVLRLSGPGDAAAGPVGLRVRSLPPQ